MYIIVYLTAVYVTYTFCCFKHHRKKKKSERSFLELQTHSKKLTNANDNHCITSLFLKDMSKKPLVEIQYINECIIIFDRRIFDIIIFFNEGVISNRSKDVI